MSRIVVKVGGAVAAIAAADALALVDAGHEVVVVHGAGPQISREMARLGLVVRFVAGRRVTDSAALEVVRASLAEVNAAVCATIGPRAVGLMGDRIGLQATRVPELGLVGDAVPCAPQAGLAALEEGLVPVIAPLAVGPLNVNADEAAAALAVGIGADRLVFITDVRGVYDGGGVLLGSLGADKAEALLARGAFEGGIVPKLTAAVRAARLGVHAEIGETTVTA